MDRWDEGAADAAVTAGLARTAGANELFELFARYGARDFRSIGHKAIFVANSWRTLDVHRLAACRAGAALAGLRPAEPRRRQPRQQRRRGRSPLEAQHGTGRPNRAEWQQGKLDDAATTDLLACPATGLAKKSRPLKVVEMLNRGVAPQSIWDALFVGAGELLARQPGIVGVARRHSTNALRYAYEASGNDDTRRMLLLQNAAFLPLFRQAMVARGGKLSETRARYA